MKIGIIGAGNMGWAMVNGLDKAKHVNLKDLYIKSGKSDKAKVLAQSVNANLVDDYQDL